MSATIWHIYVGCGEPSDEKMAAGSEQFVKASDYAALEARWQDKADIVESDLAMAQQRIAELEAALNKAVGAFETIGFHLPKDNLEAVNEAILIARGFNAWYDSTNAAAGLRT